MAEGHALRGNSPTIAGLRDTARFYIDGVWSRPAEGRAFDVVDPSTERPIATIQLGGVADLDRAVAAARRAFPAFSVLSVATRLDLLRLITDAYRRRADDLAEAVSLEMGAPITLAREAHVPVGLRHLERAATVLADYRFDTVVGRTRITREPIGVCGLITPWNWPLNQIACKVGPALAAGCTMVLKPSEFAPLSALVFAEIVEEAGVPPGVFNLVNGDGPTVGHAMAAHPDIDMISFTGSTQAGIAVAQAAAETVKRVTQELGGKSPNIILDDAEFDAAVRHGALACFRNSGQSCNAPTRLLVPKQRQEEAARIAQDVAAEAVVGDPRDERTTLGPVSNANQYSKVAAMIDTGIGEGAALVCGGTGRPNGCQAGFFVPPTVFSDVLPTMTIAREEIFGPVLSIIGYRDEDEAVEIANDTPFGLAAYVTSGDIGRARRVARRLRAGTVHLNGSRADNAAAFGGYKRSGNGREWGVFGFEEFLEVKSMFGYEGD